MARFGLILKMEWANAMLQDVGKTQETTLFAYNATDLKGWLYQQAHLHALNLLLTLLRYFSLEKNIKSLNISMLP